MAAKDSSAYLNDICTQFHKKMNYETGGWGQFLDNQALYSQVGRYGTSAGAVILAVNGQSKDTIGKTVKKTLVDWVTSESIDDTCHLIQTLPAAMMLLGISLLSDNDDKEDAESLARKLLQQRITSSSLWGNYWINSEIHDSMPSVFVSAVVLLAFSFSDVLKEYTSNLSASCNSLENLYFQDRYKHAAYAHIVLSAICRVSDNKLSRSVTSELRRLSRTEIDLSRRYTYFYDYRSDEENWGREYFIVPVDVFSPLSINRDDTPGSYKLLAKDICTGLKTNIESNNGLFLSNSHSKASTLDQLFVSLALNEERAESVSISIRSLSGLSYFLRKPLKKESVWCRWIQRILVMLAYLEMILILSFIGFTGYELSTTSDWLLKMCIFGIAVIKDPIELAREMLRKGA